MALTYKDIKNQLTILLDTLAKKIESKGSVFNKKGKNNQIILCNDILKELENHRNDTLFDLAEFIAATVAPYTPSKKTNKILNKFHKKLNELYNQLITCDELSDILKQKGILPFEPPQDAIQLSDDIAIHSELLFHKIYSKRHILDVDESLEIKRDIHGIQHVNRVTYYIPILANLYRRYDDKNAEALTNEEIKLIQIAALFHDAGRERSEGIDFWDQDSAILAFYYYRDVLRVSDAKAKLLAESIANKNMKDSKYYQLITNAGGKLQWELSVQIKKNIYQKILHDSDSLDIMRVRKTNSYNAEYLDFYQDIAKKNPQAKAEMTELIYEVRSLIEIQGDGFLRQKNNIKKYYEHAQGYQRTIDQIITIAKTQERYRLLRTLYTPNIQSLPLKQLKNIPLLKKPTLYDAERPLDEANVRAALEKGIVFTRGIADPSALTIQPHKEIETQAELEIRKTLRKKGLPTRTKKEDRLKKHGNPNRSVSLVGFGAIPFAAAGFLIIDNDPRHKKIKSIAKANIKSGFGKKKNISNLISTLDDAKEKDEALQDLITTLQMGGGNNKSAHSEIIYNIDNFDAIYFTQDAVFANRQAIGNHAETADPFHQYSPLLQAIYLQKQYEKKSSIKLPLFEYSGIHQTTRMQADLNDIEIATLFITMCKNFIEAQVTTASPTLFTLTMEQVKISSMYGDLYANLGYYKKTMQAADTYLPHELREAINKEIETEIHKARNKIIEQIRNKSLSLFSPVAIEVLKSTPKIPKDIHEIILKEINPILRKEDFLKNELTTLFDEVLTDQSPSRADDILYTLQNLKTYADITKRNKNIDLLRHIAVDALTTYLKNNLDKIMRLNARKKITFCICAKNIVDILALDKQIGTDFFVDLVIRLSRNIFVLGHLKGFAPPEHPKVLAHAHQLMAKCPYATEDFDITAFLSAAKKYSYPEQQMQHDISVYIDKIIRANHQISPVELEQIFNSIVVQEHTLKMKLFTLLPCVKIYSLSDLVNSLSIFAKIHSDSTKLEPHINASAGEFILTQLSQKLLAQFHRDPNFYASDDKKSSNYFNKEVEKLHFNPPLKLPDNYKNIMLRLIKEAPNSEIGILFIERVRQLNLQLRFDSEFQFTSTASAAAQGEFSNSSQVLPQYSFFAPDTRTTANQKESNQTSKLKPSPNAAGKK